MLSEIESAPQEMGIPSHSAAGATHYHARSDRDLAGRAARVPGPGRSNGEPQDGSSGSGEESDQAVDSRGISTNWCFGGGETAGGGGNRASPSDLWELRADSNPALGGTESGTPQHKWETGLGWSARVRPLEMVWAAIRALVSTARWVVSWVLILPILFYQKGISPFLRPRCRFYPSCSHYAVGAIRKYGPARGVVKGAWRIMRCNPWNPGGFDPP